MSRITQEELDQMDLVKWYRYLSAEQINLCNMLLTTLRDDLEQCTIYRTLEFLNKFGLTPLPDCHQIRKILKMSKGSDLAFLYFLWEADYKMNCETYTDNEKLILSGITHLDMTSTLRELDRILPPSTHSKKAVLHQQQLNLIAAKKAKRCHNVCIKSRPEDTNLKPYYQNQPKPHLNLIDYTSMPKQNKVIFPEYENYANPYYDIPNEKNRWFAQYDLQPKKRIVKKLLKTEVDRILFERIEMKLTEQEENAMCWMHRNFRTSVNQRLGELKFSTMERCMEILDIKGSAAKKRKERLVNQLEQQINMHANKLSEYSKRQYAQVRTLKKEGSECKLCLNITSLPPKQSKANLKILMGFDLEKMTEYGLDTVQNQVKVQTMEEVTDRFEVGKDAYADIIIGETVREPFSEITNRIQVTNKVENKKSNNISKKNRKKSIKSEETSQRLLGGETKDVTLQESYKQHTKLELIPTGPSPNAQPKYTGEEETFFKGNTLYKPFSFDYEKIFNTNYVSDSPSISEHDSDESVAQTVHHYCINALKYIAHDLDKEFETKAAGDAGGDSNETTQLFANKTFYKPQISQSQLNQVNQFPLERGNPADELNQAIQMCCSKMLYGPNDQQSQSQQSHVLHSVDRPCEEILGLRAFFKLPYLDPDDNELMEKLLRMALRMMAKNRKFVLATFPNAHNLPLIKDWVAERYHKTYSEIDGEKMFKYARNVYEALQHKNKKMAIPYPIEKRYKKFEVSYTHHDEILKTAEDIRSDYYRQLNGSTLVDTHLIWLAMRGYSTTNRKAHHPFFAYMPPRQIDILRYNVWKSEEFRNMVYMRNSLKAQKKNLN